MVKLPSVLFSAAIILLTGCSNPYEECIEKQKAEYRQRNPKASYGQLQSKQAEFEMMCSSYKSK
jgi:PBP1b-binding outer membrane lipoprotein LpoB